jgi:hypothetical protein
MSITLINKYKDVSVLCDYESDTYSELVSARASYINKIVFCKDTNQSYLVTIGNISPIYNTSLSSRFIKVTKSYSDFLSASLTKSVDIYTLQPKEVVKNVLLKHNTLFSGVGIVSLAISVGISTSVSKYIAPKSVTGAPSGVNFATFVTSTPQSPIDFSASTIIIANAISVGANLSLLTTGTVDIYLEIGTLPF